MKPKIVAAIANVSMASGHDGLMAIAKKLKYNPQTMDQGSVLLFINKKRDKLKLLNNTGTTLGYVKMAQGRQMPLEAIQYVSQAFAGGQINVEQAIDAFIRARMNEPEPGPDSQMYRSK